MAPLPGPRGPLAQARVAAHLYRAPALGLLDLHRRYGEVVAFGYGPLRFVALFGPAANRFILAERPELFRWRDATRWLIPIDGETALVVSDGDDHRRRRRLVQPAFATRRIQAAVGTMLEEVDRELDTWRVGQRILLHGALRRPILRTAVRALFGEEFGGRAATLIRELDRAISFVNQPLLRQVRIDLPGTRWHRARRARRRADAIVDAELARRQADQPPEARDLLDVLRGVGATPGDDRLDEGEIRDQVVSLVAAGYDTTSAAAAWTVRALLLTPGEWERTAADVADAVGAGPLDLDALRRASRLDAVVNEALRLWPPGFVSGRGVVGPFEFAGHTIPAGSIVLWSPFVTHRMPGVWPEPDRFLPDRWSDAPRDPYAFVPFGGGQRPCLGFAFALLELKVIVARLLQRVTLEPEPCPASPAGLVTMYPRHGVPARVRTLAPAR